jgi:UTP--glucose-1-phosphate uridylyltransferase
MKIRKAVITAAAPTQHTLPLQRLVDRGGVEKTALELIVEEVVSAGVEEICVVICPGDREAYARAARGHAQRLSFVQQDQPRGYGDAVCRAREFTADQSFLHLVADHLYLSHADASCARQLVRVAEAEGCAVSAVQETRENKLGYFGAVGAVRVARRSDLYQVQRVLEKPTPTQAEQELIVAGLRSGCYLCYFGMHVLTPLVMQLLEQLLHEQTDQRPLPLSAALQRLAERERYLALQVRGQRYNTGVKYGLLLAQLALSLAGSDRDQILTELVELMAASREHHPQPSPAAAGSDEQLD